MSDILKLVKSNPESSIAEEVKALLAAYDQAVAERDRLRAEVDALKKDRNEWKNRARLMREHIPGKLWPLLVAAYPEYDEWFCIEEE